MLAHRSPFRTVVVAFTRRNLSSLVLEETLLSVAKVILGILVVSRWQRSRPAFRTVLL